MQITQALAKFIDEAGVEKILRTKFYMVASNVMCATRKELAGCIIEDTYYPLEIGIVEFTLADGIIYEFNQFIDPGPIPENMARICHEHAGKHMIPLTDFNYSKGCCKDPLTEEYIPERRKEEFDQVICDIHDLIVNSIIDDIQDDPSKPIKVLFSQADQIFQNKGVLKTLGKEAGYDHFADEIEVLDVVELFFFLCRKKGYKFKAALMDILELIKFNYDGRCEYHVNTVTPNCAITVAKKYCWLMFEKLSELYEFKLKASHKPREEKKEVKVEDDWIVWQEELPSKPSSKRRYHGDDFDEPRRPTKVQNTVVWKESIGRGTTRHTNRDTYSSPYLSSPSAFASTDIRERNRPFNSESSSTTEPRPGPSRMDFRPRLPSGQPVAPSPFISYQPRGEDYKPIIVPNAVTPDTPNTSRPLGRGRGRNTKADA